jgi:hypothetical protein
MSSSVDAPPRRSATGHADDPDAGHQERCSEIGDEIGASSSLRKGRHRWRRRRRLGRGWDRIGGRSGRYDLDGSGVEVVEVVVEDVVVGDSVVEGATVVVVGDVVVDASVVVVGGTSVVVVVGAVVVVVAGIGTSTLAVPDTTCGGPAVTRFWAPWGSGPAGLPRYTKAGPGAGDVATTVVRPGETDMTVPATPLPSVNNVWSSSCPLNNTVIGALATGRPSAVSVTPMCPPLSMVATITLSPAAAAASASSAIASAWMSSRPLARPIISREGISGATAFHARLVPAASCA